MEEINCLNCPLLTGNQVRNLRKHNVLTLIDLINAPRELVVAVVELDEWDYQRLRKQVLNYLQACPMTQRQVALPKNVTARSTGCSGFDKLLGGGLFPGDVIELYGQNATGKSQICMYLASVFSSSRGGNSTVIYFDLKNDFSASRLLELSSGDETGLENVKIFRVPNLAKVLATLDAISNDFVGGRNGFYSRCKLLVLDSVPMAFYPAVQNKYSWKCLTDRLIQKLEWMAIHMQLTIILVNHAVKLRSPFSSASFEMVKAALGEYWKHKIKIRVKLCKVKLLSNSSFCYSACMEKSVRSPCEETFYFCIATDRIKGAHEK